MDADQLRAFVAVARTRRFTRAARQLGTTQPSLSRRVAALEKEVRAKLVIRSPAGVVLTSAGERFLAHAERALSSLEAGVGAIDELAGEPHGPVAVGALPSIGAYALPDVLAAFHARHPDVKLRFLEGNGAELEDGVGRGVLDLALVTLPVRHVDLAAQRLWQEDYLLTVPRGHPLAHRRAVALGDVAGEPLVVIPAVPPTAALVAACEERGIAPRVVVEADTHEGVRRLVLRGVGVALLPRLMATDPTSKGLVALEVTKGGLRRHVALIHRGDPYLTAAARALRAIVVERLRAPGRS